MKNNPLRIAFTMFVIGAVVIGLACGPAGNTNVSNSNQTVTNANVSDSNQSTKAAMGPCKLKWDDDERSGLEKKVRDAIRDKGAVKKLKKSLDGDGTNPSWMNFTIRRSPVPNYYFYEAIFYGTVGGNDQFEQLADILNDFNDEDECVRRAVFLPATTSPLLPSQRAIGFEWSACDYPNRPCSDGSCACAQIPGDQ